MNIMDKRFITVFSIIIIAWAVVYQEAILGMEAIWSRSDTFAHGYFILPISIWLLWRDKAHLLTIQIQSTWLPLPILAGSLFVWLFSYAADINVLGQLSAVISLIALIWLMVGNKIAWRYKFPLAYLIFAVPMGENLIPQLQDITAWFTVFFLKLNGIPVFVDGLYIQVPTGMFEVAVACSGIRYLIASIAVGTLFAYLTYTKTHKQIIFILFSIFLPILANGIRAYGIVAIAYYSDMKYATGVDHLIYGWIFFGIVIMLMFWIGGMFADKEDINNQVTPPSHPKYLRSNNQKFILPLLILSLLASTLFLIKSIPTVDITEHKKEETQGNVSSWGINFSNAIQTNYFAQTNVEYFQAIYANKQTKGELITWQNVTHDHDRWTIIATKKITIMEKPLMLVHLRDINGRSRSYLYQYKIGDFYSINDNKTKILQAWNSLSRQYDFGEIRALSIAGISDLTLAEQQLIEAFKQHKFTGFLGE